MGSDRAFALLIKAGLWEMWGYAAEITPEKQVSMDIRHQAVRLPKQREIYTMLSLIQPIHGGATQGKSLLLIAAALEPQRHLLRYTDRS